MSIFKKRPGCCNSHYLIHLSFRINVSLGLNFTIHNIVRLLITHILTREDAKCIIKALSIRKKARLYMEAKISTGRDGGKIDG